MLSPLLVLFLLVFLGSFAMRDVGGFWEEIGKSLMLNEERLSLDGFLGLGIGS